jgi:hypothetical protein
LKVTDGKTTRKAKGGAKGRGQAKAPPSKIAALGIPRPGRPGEYHPRFVEIARAMCRLGATDFDLAQEFGVKTQTIWNWRCRYPEFFDATLEGKEAFDNRIERSLAQRAAGYSYHSEKVFQYEGAVIRAETVEHVPPDVSAIRLWLMNRRPDRWRDKSEVKLDGSDAFLRLWTAISDGTLGDVRQEVA